MIYPLKAKLSILLLLFGSTMPAAFAEGSQPDASKNQTSHAAADDSKPEQKKDAEPIPGWVTDTADGEYEIGLDSTQKHDGKDSAFIKSIVAKPKPDGFGNLMQWFKADDYRGKHVEMSAWIKSKLDTGKAQLWVRVDGEGHGNAKSDCFDNMDDRPVQGTTDWKRYSVVVDVPETSSDIFFGGILIGTGKYWLDDITIKSVSKDVPLTGNYTEAHKMKEGRITQPRNLNFEGI